MIYEARPNPLATCPRLVAMPPSLSRLDTVPPGISLTGGECPTDPLPQSNPTTHTTGQRSVCHSRNTGTQADWSTIAMNSRSSALTLYLCLSGALIYLFIYLISFHLESLNKNSIAKVYIIIIKLQRWFISLYAFTIDHCLQIKTFWDVFQNKKFVLEIFLLSSFFYDKNDSI